MKTYLIANWKMQLSQSEAQELAQIASEQQINSDNLEIILAPTFTALAKVGETIKNSSLKLASQNVFYHASGSYTGEVSPLQLKELGVSYAIIGHSERREYLHETDEEINRKINICLDNQITPILCVGETYDERRTGATDLRLITQVTKALEDIELISPHQSLIIAYEPIWVIGSGQAINRDDAEHAARVIQQALTDHFNSDKINQKISIIYGGSVTASNIKNFIIPNLLDGVLVGSASQTPNKFIPLIQALK